MSTTTRPMTLADVAEKMFFSAVFRYGGAKRSLDLRPRRHGHGRKTPRRTGAARRHRAA